MMFERDAKLLNFVQGYVGAAKEREAAQNAGQRPHEEQRGDHVAAQGPLIEAGERGNQEQHETDQREVKQMAPGLSGDEAQLGFDVVLLEDFGGALNLPREKLTAAAAMQLEFLDAFS